MPRTNWSRRSRTSLSTPRRTNQSGERSRWRSSRRIITKLWKTQMRKCNWPIRFTIWWTGTCASWIRSWPSSKWSWRPTTPASPRSWRDVSEPAAPPACHIGHARPTGSLEMDGPSQPVNNHHVHSHAVVEKRRYSASAHHTTEHVPEKKFKSEALLSTLTSDACKENVPGCRSNSMTSSSSSTANSIYGVSSSQPLTSYGLSSLPAGPAAGAGAISMAAAQAVQATAQMKEGRRTSSLKASYEAIKNNDFQLSRDFSLSREASPYPSSALASTLTQTLAPTAVASDTRGRKSKSGVKSSNHQSSSSSSSSSLSSCSSSSALAQELSQQASVLPEAEAGGQVDWTYDPNEPRYCICNQVSYGEMVGCDNTDVSNGGPLALQSKGRIRFPARARDVCLCVCAHAALRLAVSHRVVPLRLRGSERSPQREVVLSSVHGRHETTRKQTQVDGAAAPRHAMPRHATPLLCATLPLLHLCF
ncbi:inhibitor of growth protein 3 isoform X2 [Syngnathus acus]|uniref:inhibitor of growth protein 3 isoform X2 n=1 Tax=Syngnathus acus TaxID=161584 RepID=UPI001885F330|nr:inhibitor of growth protein 3 isoform X2 [Syngnathus acus]